MTRMRKTSPGRAAFWLVVCLALAAGTSVGCGAKSKTNDLSGKVTYNGDPVTGGTVTFYPADGKGAPFSAALSREGTYTVGNLPKGKMKVTVETESLKGKTPGYRVPGGGKLPPGTKVPEVDTSNVPVYVRVPRKYAYYKTTTLGGEVAGGKQEVNFELSGKLP
jgi:hypothetical protein